MCRTYRQRVANSAFQLRCAKDATARKALTNIVKIALKDIMSSKRLRESLYRAVQFSLSFWGVSFTATFREKSCYLPAKTGTAFAEIVWYASVTQSASARQAFPGSFVPVTSRYLGMV